MGDFENLSESKLFDKNVLSLAFPVILSNVSESLIAIVDLFFVSKLGKSAITIAGLGDLYLWFIMTFLTLLSVGLTVFITRFWAKGKIEKIILYMKQSFLLIIIFSVFMYFFINLTSKKFLTLMTDDINIILSGKKFIFILSFIIFPLSVNIISKTLFNSISETKITMFLSIIANFINAIFDYIFIFKLNYGVNGAAYAYFIADFLTMIYIFYIFSRHKDFYRFFSLNTLNNLKFNFYIIRKIFYFGFPQFLQQVSIALAFIILTSFISKLGIIIFSAYQITMHFEGLIYLISGAFSVASSTLTGQMLGLKRVDLVRIYVRYCIKWAGLFSLFIGFILFYFSRNLIAFFITDINIIILGSISLKIIALIQLPMTISIILSGALNGAGDTRFTFFIKLILLWFIRLPLSYLLIYNYNFKLYGFWIALGIYFYILLIFLFYRYKSDEWLFIKI